MNEPLALNTIAKQLAFLRYGGRYRIARFGLSVYRLFLPKPTSVIWLWHLKMAYGNVYVPRTALGQ